MCGPGFLLSIQDKDDFFLHLRTFFLHLHTFSKFSNYLSLKRTWFTLTILHLHIFHPSKFSKLRHSKSYSLWRVATMSSISVVFIVSIIGYHWRYCTVVNKMSNGRRREREVGGVVRHGIKDNFAFGFTSGLLNPKDWKTYSVNDNQNN